MNKLIVIVGIAMVVIPIALIVVQQYIYRIRINERYNEQTEVFHRPGVVGKIFIASCGVILLILEKFRPTLFT